VEQEEQDRDDGVVFLFDSRGQGEENKQQNTLIGIGSKMHV
jgi:hypothetical protein